MIKFFTCPPKPYPYILINVLHPKFSFLKYAEEVIIDSGIEIFRNPNVKDYPRDHLSKLIKVYLKAKAIMHQKPIYVTCPDYCDDYHPKSLWLNEKYTNIERTVDNVLKYTKEYPWMLITIQSHNKKPDSIRKCIELYREYGILEKFDYFALGNLCVEPDIELIYKTVKNARNQLKDKKIHVFGLKLNVLKKIFTLIDSFDSMAWTRPVDTSLNANYSCKTNKVF